jgi:tRNA threonylcarbamoyladenosine biosynthesis protein TsaE
MEDIGKRMASNAYAGMHIYLRGALGTGKTTFTRGFLRGMGYEGNVKSPTYTLVEPYALANTPLGQQDIYHFDLYRLNDPLELEAMGWRDYLDSQAICLLEWPEQAGSLLTTADIDIAITMADTSRIIDFKAFSDQAKRILERL